METEAPVGVSVVGSVHMDVVATADRLPGKGESIVGHRVALSPGGKAGDLMLSAPGWAVHNHASYDDDYVYELTVQDQPLNIMMESLLWQEDLKKDAHVLGAEPGFATNRG